MKRRRAAIQCLLSIAMASCFAVRALPELLHSRLSVDTLWIGGTVLLVTMFIEEHDG